MIMDTFIDKNPQLENCVYVIGGPREHALKELTEIAAFLTSKYHLRAEFYCLQSPEDEIRSMYESAAAASDPDKSGQMDFRKQNNGDVLVINGKIKASYGRRFIRLAFIDSLESMHLKGKDYNRQDVLKSLKAPCPIFVVSEEVAPADNTTTHVDISGLSYSLTIR